MYQTHDNYAKIHPDAVQHNDFKRQFVCHNINIGDNFEKQNIL